MKKKAGLALTVFTAGLAALCLSACAPGMDKLEGSWTVKSINGKSPAEFAAQNNVSEYNVSKNYTVRDGKFTITALDDHGKTADCSSEIKSSSDGFTFTLDETSYNCVYDSSADTLSYTIRLEEGGTPYTYILKKGSVDLEGMLNDELVREAKEKKGSAGAESTPDKTDAGQTV
ncbi:MAG: hypothetical protein IKO27_00400 [Ruminococcus sp.]|nr:hypothetical protein [Ruminococcus sp.]